MHHYHPTGELSELLDRYHGRDGQMIYMLFVPDEEMPTEARHWCTAYAGVRWLEGYRIQAELLWEIDLLAGSLNSSGIDASRLRAPIPLSLSAFLRSYHDHFRISPREEMEHSISYQLFSQINALLFGDLAPWSIRQWNTDWTHFFVPHPRGLSEPCLWTAVDEVSQHSVWLGCR